jgi:hypothetical protein
MAVPKKKNKKKKLRYFILKKTLQRVVSAHIIKLKRKNKLKPIAKKNKRIYY